MAIKDPKLDPEKLTGLIRQVIEGFERTADDRYLITFARPKPHEFDKGSYSFLTHEDVKFEGELGEVGLKPGDKVLVQWMVMAEDRKLDKITLMKPAPYTMTVKELMDQLATMPADAEVSSYHGPNPNMDGNAAYHSPVEAVEFVDYDHEVQINGRSYSPKRA